MFDYFKGTLVNKNFPYCTVEVNGIGYRFLINSRTLSSLGETNTPVKIYSKLIHKEDSMMMCGFLHRQDRVIFDVLVSVSGIGTKAAMALLDEFETNELISAVINEDSKAISRTKGIGPKMAQKIVLELKDKLTKLEFAKDIIIAEINNSNISNDTVSQTVAVLESLGYKTTEIKKVLPSVDNTKTLEEMCLEYDNNKLALKVEYER